MSSSPDYKSSRVIIKVVVFSAFLFFLLPLIYAMEEGRVELSFRQFSQKWMNSLQEREEKNKKNLTCKKVKNYYRAEYMGYSRAHSVTVKKTDYKKTPYLGILSYKEKKFVCHAITFEGALRGPFTVVYECPVTELFIFSDGEWHY